MLPDGLATYVEQPLPAPLHTVSLLRVPSALSVRDVPPTAVTVLKEAGDWTRSRCHPSSR